MRPNPSNPAFLLGGLIVTLAFAVPLALVALATRLRRRDVDIGFGPEPLVNNLHFVAAAHSVGLTAESYCTNPYHIADAFDHVLARGDTLSPPPLPPRRLWLHLLGFIWTIGRFRVLAISCHGGLLGRIPVLRGLEPMLLRMAGVKTIILPYGSDVQTLDCNPSPRFREAVLVDYPETEANGSIVRRQVRRWTRKADVIINGCDWVDYLDRSDILTPGHFCFAGSTLEARPWALPSAFTPARPLRLLHAPNHPAIKGTAAVESAVTRLRAEGLPVELEVIVGRPNHEVLAAIEACDVVVDQLVIGWYAMFAIEGMAAGRAVICRVRSDLVDRYRDAGVLGDGEPPLIDADEATIESVIRRLLDEPGLLASASAAGPGYVAKHHSLAVAGRRFLEAFQLMGLDTVRDSDGECSDA